MCLERELGCVLKRALVRNRPMSAMTRSHIMRSKVRRRERSSSGSGATTNAPGSNKRMKKPSLGELVPTRAGGAPAARGQWPRNKGTCDGAATTPSQNLEHRMPKRVRNQGRGQLQYCLAPPTTER